MTQKHGLARRRRRPRRRCLGGEAKKTKSANPITKSEKPKAIFCLRALLAHFRAHVVVLQGRWSRLFTELTQKHALAHGRRRRQRRGLGGETKNPKRQNPSTNSQKQKATHTSQVNNYTNNHSHEDSISHGSGAIVCSFFVIDVRCTANPFHLTRFHHLRAPTPSPAVPLGSHRR